MKISIVVPIYNVELFLEKCIDNLLNQTLKDIQIILVNDGSTDNSLAICEKYLAQDNRVVLLNKSNGGLSDARNAGLKIVQTKYVMFLDSDDWIDVETCEYTLKIIEEQSADMIFWSTIKEFEDSSVPVKNLFETDVVLEGTSLNFLKRRVCGLLNDELNEPTKTDLISSAWAKLYRTKIIIDNEITFKDTREIGSEDTLFNFYLFQHLKKVVFINNKFNHYRQTNENSLTKNHKSSLLPRFLNLFSHMKDYINDKNLSNEYKEALSNRIAMSTIGLNLSIVSTKNSISWTKKINDISEVLSHPVYIESYSLLQLKKMPIYWKLFFMMCKYKMKYGVYVLSVIMNKLRNNN